MTPIEFPEQNMVFVGADPDIHPLPTFRNDQVTVSCWQFDDDEIEAIIKTKQVWLLIYAHGQQPPVLLQTELPFTDKSEFPDLLDA